MTILEEEEAYDRVSASLENIIRKIISNESTGHVLEALTRVIAAVIAAQPAGSRSLAYELVGEAIWDHAGCFEEPKEVEA